MYTCMHVCMYTYTPFFTQFRLIFLTRLLTLLCCARFYIWIYSVLCMLIHKHTCKHPYAKFRSCRAPIPKSFHSRITDGFFTFSVLHLSNLYSLLIEFTFYVEHCFSPLYPAVDREKLSICDMNKENTSSLVN